TCRRDRRSYSRMSHRFPSVVVEADDALMKRVLIAEDDDANRTMLARFLERRGFVVETAANGVEVLNRLREARARHELFDALLLDWMMPLLSGIAALPNIRDAEPD